MLSHGISRINDYWQLCFHVLKWLALSYTMITPMDAPLQDLSVQNWFSDIESLYNVQYLELDKGIQALIREDEVSLLGCEYEMNDSDCLDYVSQEGCSFTQYSCCSEFKDLVKKRGGMMASSAASVFSFAKVSSLPLMIDHN